MPCVQASAHVAGLAPKNWRHPPWGINFPKERLRHDLCRRRETFPAAFRNSRNATSHDHDHHHHAAPQDFSARFALGIALNITFVAIEAFYGWRAGSLALLANAGTT
jgi:hypothetical protein